MEKRVKGFFAALVVICTVLLGRTFYIQIVCGAELTEGARNQQVIKIESENNRGVIYDRNMTKLTNVTPSYYYLVHRTNCTAEFREIMDQIGGEVAGSRGTDYVIYRSDEFDTAVNKRLNADFGVYSFCINSRYADDQPAVHLIGYLNTTDNKGESGLEKLFQKRLGEKKTTLVLEGDGAGRPVMGVGLTEDIGTASMSPSALVTTIDASLQKKTEKILKDRKISGAVVILDSRTGELITMASSPTFDPRKVESYLSSGNGELINKTIQGLYPPGSVFKIAVAAAALESGSADENETFECTGSVTVNGVKLTCEEKPEGHGKLNMEQAFAQSCNCYFAKLAEKTGSETVAEMAERMGIGQTALAEFPGEEEGNLTEKSARSGSGLSNFSIGQGDLLVTPVQICRMTNIIAAGGVDRSISVIMSETEARQTRVMSKETAESLHKMMEKVMSSGTASSTKAHVDSAGKTGSAEATVNGVKTVHGWFTGFFPADNPRYTVTILVENGKTGSSSALPVFDEIVNYLY